MTYVVNDDFLFTSPPHPPDTQEMCICIKHVYGKSKKTEILAVSVKAGVKYELVNASGCERYELIDALLIVKRMRCGPYLTWIR